jgi:hypothetical protein
MAVRYFTNELSAKEKCPTLVGLFTKFKLIKAKSYFDDAAGCAGLSY